MTDPDMCCMSGFGSFPQPGMRRCPFCMTVMVPVVRMPGTNTLYCTECGRVLPS